MAGLAVVLAHSNPVLALPLEAPPGGRLTMQPSIHPITVARLGQGMSRERLARRSGVSVRTLYNIEHWQSHPRGSTRRAILRALRLPIHGNMLGMFIPSRRR
jgi:DNA-binding XRE family transcriptional regulator